MLTLNSLYCYNAPTWHTIQSCTSRVSYTISSTGYTKSI